MKLSASMIPCILPGLALASTALTAADGDWPQWRGPQRDGTWTTSIEISPENLPGRIERLWSAPVAAGYSGPTVAGDRVFLTDRIDAPETSERVHCFDRETGKPLWSHRYPVAYQVGYPLGPRAAVSVHGNAAVALGAMGHLHVLSVADGSVLWKKDLASDYQVPIPTWGITSAPLVDPNNDTVIVQVGGRPDACVVAFDLASGQEKWRALDGGASYSAPRFIRQGDRRLLLVWSGDWIAGLDPATGDPVWKEPFKKNKMVINVPDAILDEAGETLFLSSFYDGSFCYRLHQDAPGIERIWDRAGINERNTDALHCMISTPVIREGHVYGIDSNGEFRCLDLRSGDRIWTDETLLPKGRWSNAYLVQQGAITWIATEDGRIVTGRLKPSGFEKISEAPLLAPTTDLGGGNARTVNWSHPAFAGDTIIARNDRELACFHVKP